MNRLIGVTAATLLLAAFGAQAEPVVVDADAAFPEGPLMLDGMLYYAEYGAHRISTWDNTAKGTLWESPGCGPSAVAPLGDDMVVTCYDNGTLARITDRGATVVAYDKDSTGAPLVGPNDLAPDGAGGVYVTASGPWEAGPIVGKVYHLSEDGTLRMLADDLHYANSIALWNGRLYVNESEAGRVISFAVAEDGTLSDRRLFVRVSAVDPGSPGSYPDGLKVGPGGATLWIGQYSSGRLVVVNPDGTLAAVHEVPSPAAPNLAFTPDGGDAYVMAVDDTANPPYKGKVYRLPLE